MAGSLLTFAWTFWRTICFQQIFFEGFRPAYRPAWEVCSIAEVHADAQLEARGRSKSQLLIALHEVTESEYFGETISHEFTTLPDTETRFLCLIAGIATIARVGLSLDMAREALSSRLGSRSLASALNALAGIVESNADGRLFARHEMYVRHIVTTVIDFPEFSQAICALLRVFCQYEIPVIRRVNKRDAALFRLILNHDLFTRMQERTGV